MTSLNYIVVFQNNLADSSINHTTKPNICINENHGVMADAFSETVEMCLTLHVSWSEFLRFHPLLDFESLLKMFSFRCDTHINIYLCAPMFVYNLSNDDQTYIQKDVFIHFEFLFCEIFGGFCFNNCLHI